MNWSGELYEDRDVCYLFSETGVRELMPVKPAGRGPAEADDGRPVVDVDDLPLVFHEGCFAKTGKYVFEVEEEGLYRFFLYPDRVCNRICYRENIPRFAGAIGQLHLHGWRQNELPADELIEKAHGSFLSITCGTIAKVAMELFRREGITVRRVTTTTLDQWNSYNRGHSLFEYLDPVEDRFILADTDFGVIFQADGRWLDTDEICGLIRGGKPWDMVEISSGAYHDLSTDGIEPQIVFHAMGLARFNDSNQKRMGLERLLQVPRFEEFYTVDNLEQRERFEALCGTTGQSYTFLNREAFRQKFYS